MTHLFRIIRWFQGLLVKLRGLSYFQNSSGDGLDVTAKQPLVQQRPISLETRYVPVQNAGDVERLFARLHTKIFGQIDKFETGRADFGTKVVPKMLRESGRLPGRRRYFFVQPLSRDGWLFERSETGWVISQARKIVKERTFMRAYDHWDIVTIYEPSDGQGTLRLTSKRFEDNLVGFSVYEQKVLKSLDLQ